MKRQIHLLICFLIACGVVAASQSTALAENCDTLTPKEAKIYTASILTPISLHGAYKVFAKTGRAGQSTTASVLHTDQQESKCISVGISTINDNLWTSIGDISAHGEYLDLQVALFDVTAEYDASGPKVLLVPLDSPCTDPNNCLFKLGNTDFDVLPSRLSNTLQTLNAYILQYPSSKSLPIYTHFYDTDREVYSSKGYSKLNNGRLTSGMHDIVTIVNLENGINLRQKYSVEIEDSLSSFAVPFIYKHSSALLLFFIAIAIYVLLLLLISVVRYIRKRRQWLSNHVNKLTHIETSNANPIIRYKEYLTHQSKSRDKKVIVVILLTPILVLLLILTINTYFIGFFKIKGISMEPTLANGTNQVLNKTPVFLSHIKRSTYMPERGTVVVFKKFHNQLTDGELDPENALVVKRVLALPGERVVVKGTDLLVYNEDHPDGFMPDNNSSWSSVIASTTPRNVDITLKEGELFVAGDDRENSVDSRDYGPINISQIQGAVLYRHKGKLSPYQVMHE